MKKIIAMVMCAALLLSFGAAMGEQYEITTDASFRPFEYTDKTGTLVGIDVEILAAVARDQGFDYTLEPLGWTTAIAACQSGMKDGLMAAASITEDRKAEGWIFSDPYFTATQSMAVAQGVPIKSFEDLRGHSVAVNNNTTGMEYAESLAEQYGFKVVPFDSSLAAYMAVTGGQCAACFDDTPALEDYIVNGGVFLQMVEGTANEGTGFGFVVFSPDKQELLDKFNAGLANIKASGEYDQILAKYLSK